MTRRTDLEARGAVGKGPLAVGYGSYRRVYRRYPATSRPYRYRSESRRRRARGKPLQL